MAEKATLDPPLGEEKGKGVESDIMKDERKEEGIPVEGSIEMMKKLTKLAVDTAAVAKEGNRAEEEKKEKKNEEEEKKKEEKKEVSLKCYYCEEKGHLKKDCPQIECMLCKKKGHLKANCPSFQCHKCNERGHMAKNCLSEMNVQNAESGKAGNTYKGESGLKAPRVKGEAWGGMDLQKNAQYTMEIEKKAEEYKQDAMQEDAAIVIEVNQNGEVTHVVMKEGEGGSKYAEMHNSNMVNEKKRMESVVNQAREEGIPVFSLDPKRKQLCNIYLVYAGGNGLKQEIESVVKDVMYIHGGQPQMGMNQPHAHQMFGLKGQKDKSVWMESYKRDGFTAVNRWEFTNAPEAAAKVVATILNRLEGSEKLKQVKKEAGKLKSTLIVSVHKSMAPYMSPDVLCNMVKSAFEEVDVKGLSNVEVEKYGISQEEIIYRIEVISEGAQLKGRKEVLLQKSNQLRFVKMEVEGFVHEEKASNIWGKNEEQPEEESLPEDAVHGSIHKDSAEEPTQEKENELEKDSVTDVLQGPVIEETDMEEAFSSDDEKTIKDGICPADDGEEQWITVKSTSVTSKLASHNEMTPSNKKRKVQARGRGGGIGHRNTEGRNRQGFHKQQFLLGPTWMEN